MKAGERVVVADPPKGQDRFRGCSGLIRRVVDGNRVEIVVDLADGSRHTLDLDRGCVQVVGS